MTLAGNGACIESTITNVEPAGDVDDVPASPNGDPTENVGELCNAQVSWISPDDAEAHVSVHSKVLVSLTEPAPPDSWTLLINNADGHASLDASGTLITWEPDEPLANNMDYSVEVSLCGVPSFTSFTTIGEPLTEEALQDRTYVVDIDEMNWLAPATSGVFTVFLHADHLLIDIVDVDVDAGLLVLMIGGEDSYGEAWCDTVIELHDVDFAKNPRFSAGPVDLQVFTDTGELSLEDVHLDGVFAWDGSVILQPVVSGLIDTVLLDELLDTDTCELSAMLGDPCLPCSDGQIRCLQAVVTADESPAIEGLTSSLDGCP